MMRRVVLGTAYGADRLARRDGSERSGNTGARAAPGSPVTRCGVGGCRKPGGGLWVCTFADEFNGTSLDRTKWLPQTNFATGGTRPSTRSCHVDNPANVAVGQGHLELTVRKVSAPVVCQGRPANYTSGQVSTYRRFSQQYGRFEARMKTSDHRSHRRAPGGLLAVARRPGPIWTACGRPPARSTSPRLYSRYNSHGHPITSTTRGTTTGGPKPGVNTANCPACARRSTTPTR